jgi:hypothetical protein
MRRLGTLLLTLTVALCFLVTAEAGGEKGKERTITGRITCHKCDFKTVKEADGAPTERPTTCYTVIIGKRKDKSVVFYFDKASHKKYHGKICTSPMEGTVTGTITKKDGKRIITATEVKFKD